MEENFIDDVDDNEIDTSWMDEYQESMESLCNMVDDYDKLTQTVQTIISNESINTFDVASLEAVAPGILLDDYDVQDRGGVFSQEAYSVSLEKVIDTEMDMAFFLMGKFFKMNLRAGKMLAAQSAKLAGVVATVADSHMVNSKSVLLNSTIDGRDNMAIVNFKALPETTQAKLVKLVKAYTGNEVVGEAEVIKTLAAVKSSKNGIEIMSKVYMPKYRNLLIPLFYIPSSEYKGILKFFQVMDDVVLPRIDTNLNTGMMQLNTIIGNRDWVAMSKFNTKIFQDEDKKPIYQVAKIVQAPLSPQKSFRKNSAKTYASLSVLFGSDKKGLKNDPKYHQQLPASVKDLDAIKNHVISISDIMSDMNKHSDSRTSALSKDLKRFRASKTVKESVNSGRVINKYSNAAYSRVIKELRDVAVLAGFMTSIGTDVLNAYTGVFTRSNKINSDTVKFIHQLNKIMGV